jgi:transcriptional regulator with GAF, ATPase, and Fis domain
MAKSASSDEVQRLQAQSAGAELACQLFQLAAAEHEPAAFLRQALPLVARMLGVDYLAVLQGAKGQWRTVAVSGTERAVPLDLLSEGLDSNEPATRGDWHVRPLAARDFSGEMLAAYHIRVNQLEMLAPRLAAALAHVRARQRDQQQIARQAALLEIVADWTRTLEMDKLLARMAQTAAKLLKAERASIFLWDRATQTLVGRPALGVAAGELRIADNTGIVGQVVHDGQPRRVDADVAAEQREIDRQVDQQLKFQTRSLLCVPLRGPSGELLGAFELINKIGGNFTADDEQALCELATHAAIALENSQQWEQLASARQQIADLAEQRVRLIGECSAIAALRSTISRVADTELAVLILGESGTGKEVVAQMIHYRSRRRQEPLIAVNCAAMSETLLESELFGHEKGAFTDARDMRRGKFELAGGGTLFLDEVGELSLSGQAKLLRVLEEKTIVRVGGSKPIAVGARVIAATNQRLAELVVQRRFREDLFFRLNVVTLELPPLSERGDDVLLLAEHFLKHFCALARRRVPKFTAAARKGLLAHVWPGNVRELRNAMERLAYLAPEGQDKIDAPDLAFVMSPGAATADVLSLELPLGEATRAYQRAYIEQHIDRARGNMTAAAEKLGLARSNLYRKMRQLGMTTGDG